MNNEAMGNANLQAVQILKNLHGNLPSNNQREILAKFTGWGAIADVFDTSNGGWKKRVRDELQQLLSKNVQKNIITLVYFTCLSYNKRVISKAQNAK